MSTEAGPHADQQHLVFTLSRPLPFSRLSGRVGEGWVVTPLPFAVLCSSLAAIKPLSIGKQVRVQSQALSIWSSQPIFDDICKSFQIGLLRLERVPIGLLALQAPHANPNAFGNSWLPSKVFVWRRAPVWFGSILHWACAPIVGRP